MASGAAVMADHGGMKSSDKRLVIGASLAGTISNWYEASIDGALSSIPGKRFFSADNPALWIALVPAGFAVGFLPLISSPIVARTGDPHAGIRYSIIVVAVVLIVALWGLRDSSRPAMAPATFA